MFSEIAKSMPSQVKLASVCGIISTGFAATALISGTPALATPGSGFSAVRASIGTFAEIEAKADKSAKWDAFLKTKDVSTIGVDLLTIQTSGYSGWHTHAGITLVTVKSGQVAVTDGDDCSTKVYQAGEGFVDRGGTHAHNVSNPYGLTAELVAVQIRPEGAPGRIDAPAPANCRS